MTSKIVCFNVEREASENIKENERECFKDTIVSSRNLNDGFVEPTNPRKEVHVSASKIVACIFAASFYITVGLTLAYPLTIIFHLEEIDAEIHVTKEQPSWIKYFQNLYMQCGYVLVSALLGGFPMEIFGRLRVLQIGAILSVIGWILIACSNNVSMFLIGCLIGGLSIALATSPAIVYITEVARPKLRGSLISYGPMLAFFGMLLSYLKGAYLNWRLVAWLSIIYSIVPVIRLQCWVPELPVWLVSKGRIVDAKKSLEWLYKNEKSQDKVSLIEAQFPTIMNENEIKLNEQRRSKHGNAFNKLRGFLKPTGWKPMTILFFFFAFQQFSGIYIMLFYVVIWFQEVRTCAKYLSLIIVGLTSICFIVNIKLLRRYKRGVLCIISFLGMAICMTVSNCFFLNIETIEERNYYWVSFGREPYTWYTVGASALSVTSRVIDGRDTDYPLTMTAELFPTEIRAIAQSIIYFMANMLTLAALHSYPSLEAFLGGSYSAVQWFFAGVSVGAALFVWLTLPETHGKKLSEIEEYFHNKK